MRDIGGDGQYLRKYGRRCNMSKRTTYAFDVQNISDTNFYVCNNQHLNGNGFNPQ
jgi:hypothetical protein